MCLMLFHVALLLIAIVSRRNGNFQLCLSILACKFHFVILNRFYCVFLHYQHFFMCAVSGVYFAERINSFLGENWKTFASQNYFDPHGLFISVLWSGPLLLISVVIVVS